MNVYIDLETIPDQREGAYEAFLSKAISTFRVPSDLSKKKAVEDLGMTDKENIKAISKDEAIALWHEEFKEKRSEQEADNNYRNTSFDPGKGQIFSIAWAVQDGEIRSVWRKPQDDEREFLWSFFSIIEDEIQGDVPTFVAHNAPFDLGFLYRRAVILGVRPPFKIPFGGRHGQHYYCTSQAWTGMPSKHISQKNLCAAMGVEGKPDDIDGSEVWDHVKRGEYKKVVEYNEYDVDRVRFMHKRLTFTS